MLELASANADMSVPAISRATPNRQYAAAKNFAMNLAITSDA
jgi:hypothetical protein